MLGGGVLQVVRLVDDEALGGGEDGAAGSHVAEQEGVVDYDDVGALGGAAGAEEEAAAVADVGADAAGEAIFSLSAEVRPGGFLVGAETELGAVAALGRAEPDEETRQEAAGRRSGGGGELRAGRGGGAGGGGALLRDAAQAEVIAAAFERGDGEGVGGFVAEGVAQEQASGGHVVGDELLLQVEGVGGDKGARPLWRGRGAPPGSGRRATCRCRCRPRPRAVRPRQGRARQHGSCRPARGVPPRRRRAPGCGPRRRAPRARFRRGAPRPRIPTGVDARGCAWHRRAGRRARRRRPAGVPVGPEGGAVRGVRGGEERALPCGRRCRQRCRVGGWRETRSSPPPARSPPARGRGGACARGRRGRGRRHGSFRRRRGRDGRWAWGRCAVPRARRGSAGGAGARAGVASSRVSMTSPGGVRPAAARKARSKPMFCPTIVAWPRNSSISRRRPLKWGASRTSAFVMPVSCWMRRGISRPGLTSWS